MDSIQSLDRLVGEASREIRLFFHVSPANADEQRERFLSQPGRDREPAFVYPELSFDAQQLLERLERISVPEGVLGQLYRDKCRELADTVKLLQARGCPSFLGISESLFGRPPSGLVSDARKFLKRPREPEPRNLTEDDVCRQLEAHVSAYQRRYPDFQCRVTVDPRMSANMYVSGHVIHVKPGLSVSEKAAACDCHHEIDAHILTHLNGRSQPYEMFSVGLSGYMAFQESLGVFSEIVNQVFYPGRAATLCARVVAVDALVSNMSFCVLFEMLMDQHGLDRQEAYTICQRVFRGGGFTKDWLYLSQLKEIFDYLASGHDMGLLLLGKVTLPALPSVRELLEQGTLRPPRYLPVYLDKLEAGEIDLEDLLTRFPKV